jgi:hypothetical protein
MLVTLFYLPYPDPWNTLLASSLQSGKGSGSDLSL